MESVVLGGAFEVEAKLNLAVPSLYMQLIVGRGISVVHLDKPVPRPHALEVLQLQGQLHTQQLQHLRQKVAGTHSRHGRHSVSS